MYGYTVGNNRPAQRLAFTDFVPAVFKLVSAMLPQPLRFICAYYLIYAFMADSQSFKGWGGLKSALPASPPHVTAARLLWIIYRGVCRFVQMRSRRHVYFPCFPRLHFESSSVLRCPIKRHNHFLRSYVVEPPMLDKLRLNSVFFLMFL